MAEEFISKASPTTQLLGQHQSLRSFVRGHTNGKKVAIISSAGSAVLLVLVIPITAGVVKKRRALAEASFDSLKSAMALLVEENVYFHKSNTTLAGPAGSTVSSAEPQYIQFGNGDENKLRRVGGAYKELEKI